MENALNEELRLLSLGALAILDTPPEPRFDKFTALAAAAFGTPIALLSFVDAERQWFKSRLGLDTCETPRSLAFCSHAIESDHTMVVPDATLDPRFAGNALVTGAPHIRFYAGHPITTTAGYRVGTLCIIDTKPRSLTAPQRSMLRSLAIMVESELNEKEIVAARERAEAALVELNTQLEARVTQRTAELEEKNDALSREIRQRCAIEATLLRSEERIRTMIDTSFSAFVAADADGKVIEWNASAERVFGWRRDEVINRPLAPSVIPAKYWSVGLAAGTVQLPARTKAGSDIIVEMTISTFSLDGQAYFGAYLHDVSDAISARMALEQQQELLDAVLETVDVGVIACDAEGKLSFFNRAAREFHGQNSARLDAGSWAEHYDLYEADGCTRLAPHDIPLLRALSGETVKDATMVIAPRGMKRRTVLASGRPLANRAGERLGAVVAMKDLTELSEWQAKLRANEQRLRLIAENLPALIGQVDRSGRFVFLNTKSLVFFGQPAEKLLGQPVRNAYSEAEYAKIEQHIEGASAGRKMSFESGTVVRGRQFFYHAAYVPQFDAKGAPDGFLAMAFDITARRESELLQAVSEERLRTITNNVPVLISYLDIHLHYQFANAMYKEWLGVRSEDMIGKSITQVFGDSYFEERKPSLERALGGAMSNVELKVSRKGHDRILSTTYIPHQRDGIVVGIYVLATDATAARQHERQLLALANADPLTGLPNRRMYEFNLSKALATNRRQKNGLALMYLDLDNFKHINDSFGHAAGDEVLVEFGKRIKPILRETDMLARLAGDEFTITLEAVTTPESCELIAEKILDVLAPPFVIGNRSLAVSASIGVVFAGEGSSFQSLSHQADLALYSAKRSGKKRFCMVSEAAQPIESRDTA